MNLSKNKVFLKDKGQKIEKFSQENKIKNSDRTASDFVRHAKISTFHFPREDPPPFCTGGGFPPNRPQAQAFQAPTNTVPKRRHSPFIQLCVQLCQQTGKLRFTFRNNVKQSNDSSM